MIKGISTNSKIIDECRHENINPCDVTYYSSCCIFNIIPDEIRTYFMEYKTGRFKKIIK